MTAGGDRRAAPGGAKVTRPAVLASHRSRARRRRRGLRALAVAVLLGAGGVVGPVPDPTARASQVSLSGSIVDLATEAPVPWATVRVGAYRASADGAGAYAMEVAPGRYRIQAVASGYSQTTMEGVVIGSDSRVVDVGLVPDDPDAAGARRIVARLTAPPGTDSLVDPPGSRRTAGAAADQSPFPGLVTMAGPVTSVPREIRVLMPGGDIVAMDTDEYLMGVVPSEMGYVFRRAKAALQAQAIAARTYAARGCLADSAGDPARCEPGLDANVDTTTRTQVWRPIHYEVSDQAVLATHGQAVLQAGRLIPSLYFARTFERTLSSAESGCCGGRAWSFLVSVSSPDPFRRRLGHGAGMSQEGAATFAAWGATAQEILEHYYSGATVSPPGRPSLREPVVEPRIAAIGQAVGFRVTYADPDADPPAVAEAVLDDTAFPMHPSPAPWDYRAGVVYSVTRTLTAGSHRASFRFGDGYTEPVEIDGGQIQVGSTSGSPPLDSAQGTSRAEVLVLRAVDLAATRGEALRSGAAVSAAGAEPVVLVGPTLDAGLEFMAVGARGRGTPPTRSGAQVSIRASRDGASWSEWVPAVEDQGDHKEAPPAGEWWSRLVVLRGRFLQVRVVLGWGDDGAPASLEDVTLYAIDASAGPGAPVRGTAAPGAAAAVIDRAGWGADEALRFDRRGKEIWPVEYTRPRAVVVHHTVTAEDPADPAAVVRAIYYYHAVSRGWGDIGYNFLVDHRGNVYAGRYGGERDGLIAQGGHARQFNPNTIGVALLGTFTAPSARPSAAALDSLEGLLASRSQRYGIDSNGPVRLARVQFPVSLLGHRDVLPGVTQCPGDGVNGLLDEVRAEVARRVGAMPPPATATAGPPRTVTPTASTGTTTPGVPGCSDIVAGGDFEADGAAWERRRAYLTAWDAHGGQRSMFVGLTSRDPDDETSEASASQRVAVPVGASSGTLSFAAKTYGGADDVRAVRLMDDTGREVAARDVDLDPGQPWRGYAVDVSGAVSAAAGGGLRVEFRVVNNGDGDRSYMRIDDVSLVACAARAGPPAPTPEARDGGPGTECGPLLDGGSFEVGDPPWRLSGDWLGSVTTADAVVGSRSLRLGSAGPAGFGYSAASMPISAPGRVISASLSLWLRAGGGVVAAPVELRNTARGEGWSLADGRLGSDGWRHVEVDLEPSRVAGAEVYVAVLTRGEDPGDLWVDDVRVEGCYERRWRALVPAAFVDRRRGAPRP